MKAAEARIAELEETIAREDAALADFKSAEESARIGASAAAHRTELEETIAVWERVSAELEALS